MTHCTSCILLFLIIIGCSTIFTPQSVFAQDENISAAFATNTAVATETAVVTNTTAVSSTIQITAENPQAIRTLLEGEATVPGDYPNYAWATFWALVFGGLGGLVFELLRLRGLLPLPYLYPQGQLPSTDLFKVDSYIRPKRVIDLGFVARMFVGAMAALAVLLVISPPQRMQFIAATILAGSAGASIFDSLRARLTASLAIADATEIRMKSQDLQQRLDAMDSLVNQLLKQSRPAALGAGTIPESLSKSLPGADGQAAESGVPQQPQLNVDVLDELLRKLGEAKGIRSSMERSNVLE